MSQVEPVRRAGAGGMERAEQVAIAVLYEGYSLYPYRPSAIKNRQRWTFGGVYPRAHSVSQVGGSDPCCQQTQCLIVGGPATRVDVGVRFLHLLTREVRELASRGAVDGESRAVEWLRIGDQVYHTWEEAVECVVECRDLVAGDLLARPHWRRFRFAGSHEVEVLRDGDGLAMGLLVRRQRDIRGAVQVALDDAGAGAYRLTVRVFNLTPLVQPAGWTRADVLARSFVSTHAILGARKGEFVSLLDPPHEYRQAAADCRNAGAYPVLVGEEGRRDLMLSSPIILYDYPQVSPQSAGDLFDGTEIDEILSLRILTLTDEEKQEVRQSDERGRALLERTESLPPELFMRLHGVLHNLGPAGAEPAAELAHDADSMAPWVVLEDHHVALDSVSVGGTTLKKGDHVRLRPKRTADAFDMLLNGHVATVESIEQDYEERILLAVTVDDDPGRDFGVDRKPAHRFFYGPDEVERLGESGGEGRG
jgi:hypothetical protein